jgi:hypothetical protein
MNDSSNTCHFMPVTKQTKRDHIEGDRRMNDCAPLYTEMEERLKPFAKKALLDAAESMHKTRAVPWPDRICYRCRQPLVCHYCKFFPDFPLGFRSLFNVVGIPKHKRHQDMHTGMTTLNPPGEATQDLIGAFQPVTLNGESLNHFTLSDEDSLEFWFRTN